MERRYSNLEVRSDDKKIIGTAARYYDGTEDTQFRLWGNVYERIAKGTFDEALENDVVALFNHDPNQVLGRTPATLKLSTDERGLNYEIDPDDTTIATDVMKMIRRGDVRGSSFAFKVTDEDWEQDGHYEIRTIKKVQLFDVSPTTYPAFNSTNVSLRSNELIEVKDSYNFWQTHKRLQYLKTLKP